MTQPPKIEEETEQLSPEERATRKRNAQAIHQPRPAARHITTTNGNRDALVFHCTTCDGRLIATTHVAAIDRAIMLDEINGWLAEHNLHEPMVTADEKRGCTVDGEDLPVGGKCGTCGAACEGTICGHCWNIQNPGD